MSKTTRRLLTIVVALVTMFILVALFATSQMEHRPAHPGERFILIPSTVAALTQQATRGDKQAAKKLYMHYALGLGDVEQAQGFSEFAGVIKRKD